MRRFTTSAALNASAESAKADGYTSKPIRLFQFRGRKHGSPVSQPGRQTPWSPASHTNVPRFSAVRRHDIAAIWVAFFSRWQRYRCRQVCWFGGRDTFDSLGGEVPIGLVESDVGGTGVEFWSPAASIAECSQKTPSTSGPNRVRNSA